MKGVVAGLFLSFLAIAVTAAFLELGVRTWASLGGAARSADLIEAERTSSQYRRGYPALAEPNPDRIFELRARAQQLFATDEFVMKISTNSGHLRDQERPAAKTPGRFRILALGDSFTFGWGVQVDETWWAILGRLVGREMSPRPVDVVNLGVYSYTFDQQVQRLEDLGLPYEPDLIVADFYYPHIATIATHVYAKPASKPWARITDPNVYVDDEGFLRYGRPLPFEGLRRWSALADFVVSRSKRFQYEHSSAGQFNEFELLNEEQRRNFDRAWELTRGAYERLWEIGRTHGIPIVVFSIPRDMQVRPEWKVESYRRAATGLARFSSRYPQERFATMCQDLGLRCFDLLPVFSQRAAANPGQRLYFGTDVHWTPAGHALAARSIFEYLVASRVVQGRGAGAQDLAAARR